MRPYKVSNLKIDQNLLYVIQKVALHNTEDILCNLWEAALTIVNDGLARTKARQLNKRVKLFYQKDERLPLLIEATTNWFTSHDSRAPGEPINVFVDIKFPRKNVEINVDQVKGLYEERMEKAIGLTDTVTRLNIVDKPEVKIPKHIRDVL